MEDAMENRTKPSPSRRPLPRGEGEHANASSRLGECRLRSHAPKLGATAAHHHLHDRTPWRTRPFQMSRMVLPLPWGEGGVRGKGLACRLQLSFQPLAPVSIPPQITRNHLEYPLWMMRKHPVPLWNNPHRRRVEGSWRRGLR